MELKVKLEIILEALDSYDDVEEYGWYISVDTGEIFVLWDEQVNGEYDEELYNKIVEHPEQYIQLPDYRKIDHLKMMEEFVVNKVSDAKQKKQLTKVIKFIKRKRWFGKFDAEIYALGLLNEWNEYQSVQCEKYAREWCAERNITII